MKNINSTQDVKNTIKGFIWSNLSEIPSAPTKNGFRPGLKAYEWCKKIQGDGCLNPVIPGVYIPGVYGENRTIFGKDLSQILPQDFLDLVLSNSTHEDVKYSGTSANCLDRIGTIKGPISESALETSRAISPHAVKRWRRDYKISDSDMWCLILVTNNKSDGTDIESYLHRKNKDAYGHQHMLHEYTNNKSSKGYDAFGMERYLETLEGEEGMAELAKWTPKMVEKFNELRNQQVMEKYPTMINFV